MSSLNDVIHSVSMKAFQRGQEIGIKIGREDALHETFRTLDLILTDIWQYYYDYPAQKEAVCKIQGEVEALQERLNALRESE